MYLIVTSVLFFTFATNVALGAAGLGSFLNDVAEMLVLLATTITFVAAILKKEAAGKKQN